MNLMHELHARPDDAVADRLAAVRARTPARLFVGGNGATYATQTQLALWGDHAAARDAVQTEVELERDFGREFVERWGLFEVRTRATSKTEFLMRPDLGRLLEPEGSADLARRCPIGADLQVVVGDGLSSAAVVAQVPELLPLLAAGAAGRGWRWGQPFFVRHCRVGILNEVGERLVPGVVVLLIGERPGLATAQSLSAYMAYRPRPGHTDADRNLVSNIHSRGVPGVVAAERIFALGDQMMRLGTSGVSVKETVPGWIGTVPVAPVRGIVGPE
jgi:ethanolamine ammonia-lyase small subunit